MLKRFISEYHRPVFVLMVLVSLSGFLFWWFSKPALASWFDDNWKFRNIVPVNNTGAAQNGVYIAITIDTSTTANFKSNCGDLRWTDYGGNVQPYTIASGCGTVSTVIHLNLASLPAGTQNFYYYYGNPAAADGFLSADIYPVYSSVTIGTIGTQEKANQPVAYWKFDDGQGTSASDSTTNNNLGTLTGAISGTIPTWQVEDLCVSGKCLYFEGSSAKVTVSNTINGVQTVSMWVNYASSSGTIPLIALTSTADVKITTGNTVATDGFTSPTIYVNGVNTTVIAANKWNLVEVTTGTGINSNAIAVGLVGTTYLQGFADDVKLYAYARSAAQIQLDYNVKAAAVAKGVGTLLGAQTNDPLSNGLVGYWKMDENTGTTANDSSGNVKTASITAGTGGWTNGKFGSAFSFDGAASSGTEITTNSTFTTPSVMTWSAWIYPKGLGALSLGTIFALGPSGGTNGTVRFRVNTNNVLNFQAVWSTGSLTVTTPTNSIALNTWQHVAVAYDTSSASNRPSIYINGVLQSLTDTSNNSGSISLSASTWVIGNRTIQDLTFNGIIDEMRVYTRLLSPAEIQQLYNFAPGPAAYWPFEEGQGSTVNDKSGSASANTGTWNGTGATHWVAGQYGWAGNFNGVDDFVSAANAVSNTGTVEFWVNPKSTGNNYIGMDASHYITDSGGTLSATGFSSPTIYVNGIVSSTITANVWQHVAVTTATPVASGAITIGKANGAFLTGKMDEVRIYNYARSIGQIVQDLNAGHPLSGSPVSSPADYWKFDEGFGTTANSSGYQRTAGTLTNMASPPSVGTDGWQAAGKFGKSLGFNGSNGYVDFGRMSYTESIGTMSASFWVNPNSLATQKCLLCKWDNTAAAGSRSWAIETGSANASAVLVEISTDGNTGIASGETPTGQLSVGAWTHVEVVYDSSQIGNANVLKIYINGVSKTLTFSGTIPSSTQAVNVNVRAGGSSDATAARMFSGLLDEMKVYAGALSAANVLVDFNHGSAVQFGVLGVDTFAGKAASNSAGTTYCVPGDTSTCNPPLDEWHMEEAQGTTANDTGTGAQTNKNMTITQGAGGWVAGKLGSAYNFDGKSGGTKFQTGGTFSIPTKDSYEAWIYPRTLGLPGKIIALGSSGSPSLRLEMDGLNGAQNLIISVGWTTGSVAVRTGGNSITFNTWHHVAMTYDSSSASNRPIVYIDGIKQALTDTSSNSGSFSSSAVSWDIGNGVAGAATFDGFIDEARVYDYIRSAAQIKWDMDRGMPNLWWKFDECQGSTVHNSSNTIMDQNTNGTITIGAGGSQTAVGDCNTSGTAWFNGKTGKYNYSLNLDGNDDYVSASNGTVIATDSATTTNASWGGWVKPTAAALGVIMHKDLEFKLTTNATGKPSCGINSSGWQMATASAALTAGAWSHLLCTYDGANIKVYVNGVNTASAAQTGNITSTKGTAVYVGKDPSPQDALFSGQVDEMKAWNYPLTAVQVRNEYSQGSAVRFGPTTGAP